MNDQLKFLEAEELVSCPYNIAHTCPRKRLAFHLIKCRKQHLELAKELRECIHNIQHKIPRPEYEYHLETCPDRDNYYQAQYQVGEVENQSLLSLYENVRLPVNIPVSDENWEEEPPVVNILERVKQEAQAKNVLENFSNEPPSVRKARREESRRKYREMQAEAERREKELKEASKPSSSRHIDTKRESHSSSRRDRDRDDRSHTSSRRDRDRDDCSSVVSLSSARSDVSFAKTDVSYKTAMTNAQNTLNDFQTVERKKRMGRGSGLVSSQMPLQQGIGRGRKLGAYRSDEVWSSRRTDRGERPYSSYRPY